MKKQYKKIVLKSESMGGRFSDDSWDAWIAWVLSHDTWGCPPGSFHENLINAAIRADGNNLVLLRKSYPQLVDAIDCFRGAKVYDHRFMSIVACRDGRA